MLEWKENLNDKEWDTLLTLIKGHPLQSAVWGNSKKLIDKIDDIRWAAFSNGVPVFLVRFEIRYVLKKIKIAWIPKGPVVLNQDLNSFIYQEFFKRLKKRGYFLCFETPWRKVDAGKESKSDFFTIWVDLQLGKEQLWKNLNKQFRYDIKRSKKLGVTVEKTNSSDEIINFYKMCKKLSLSKNFYLPTSCDFMLNLFEQSSHIIETLLFVARYEGNFCGGAVIIRCGQNVHYMWGAVDRLFSHLSIGQAIQWDIIEWAISENCIQYDLEGITRSKNSGVDNFKKKIGGKFVVNPGFQIYSFTNISKLCAYFLKSYLFFAPRLRTFKNSYQSKIFSNTGRRLIALFSKEYTKKY